MRFKLDLKNTELDWENPNILDYRYIDYLKNMILERYQYSWFIDNVAERKGYPFMNNMYFYPNGILNYKQLQIIYSAMLFLAIHGYMNISKFDKKYFKYR